MKISEDYHFRDKPVQLRKAYDRLVESLKQVGEFRIDPVKNGIMFSLESHFAAVYPQKNAMKLALMLDRALVDPRVFKSSAAMPGRFVNYVKLSRPADVDEELIEWLKEALWLQLAK